MSENYQIGRKFYNEKEYDKALEYFLLATYQGFAKAQYNLGYMYENGYGVEKSSLKALEYYQLAADKGFAKAQYNLGNMYRNGYGVEQSYQKALEYYQLAADQGLKEAQHNLSKLKSSKKYICYVLLEHQKIIEHLKQQIEFLELQIKYQPGGSSYQETKKHFESLATNE